MSRIRVVLQLYWSIQSQQNIHRLAHSGSLPSSRHRAHHRGRSLYGIILMDKSLLPRDLRGLLTFTVDMGALIAVPTAVPTHTLVKNAVVDHRSIYSIGGILMTIAQHKVGKRSFVRPASSFFAFNHNRRALACLRGCLRVSLEHVCCGVACGNDNPLHQTL